MWKRWWLFHATDFQSLMYPCFNFCCILGILPYKINVSTFEASRPRYILSAVITCVCGIFDLFLIYGLISEINLGSVHRTLEVTSYYTFSGFIMIITHILNGPRMRLLQTILEVSSKLPPESYQKLSRWIHVKDIFGTIFLVVQLCIYFFTKLLFEVNYLTILTVMFTIYLNLLEFHINMMYMNCVCVLKACFKKINENLQRMQKFIVIDIKPCVSRLVCRMPRNQFLLIELKILKKQHLMVSDAMKMLNIIFSLQLLATIAMIFSNGTFEIYFYVVRWQDGLRFNFDWRFFNVVFISIIFYFIKITLLVWACETSKNQAQELSTSIHDVLNSTSDEQIKDELRLFSLQILHRENTFSGKGFTMDATLLTTIVGNITTYMLILIQFLIASHSCDKKSGSNVTNNSVSFIKEDT
ncbi:uncharacterized protein [Temnothorax longispinosus]|uniref:uncharacterized protein n=1 Tax=Temnothorax longispinosus TaxID=300112 RepID=UPI003A99993F